MTNAVDIAQLGTINVTMRNRIINGAMMIDQRNAGAALTVNSTAAFFAVDRFYGQGQSTDGVYTLQQVSDGPSGFTKSLKVTVTTADASLGATQYYNISQSIEGFNCADFGWGTASAQTVTLSFWVKSSVTGTFSGAFNNSANNRSYPFTFTIPGGSANTWVQISVTIPGDTTGTWLTDNSVGIKIFWSFGTGSTYSGTAGAWAAGLYIAATGSTNLMATNGATFYITGVQLEAGTAASPFENRLYGTELALCQRYFCKTYDAGVATGTNTTNGWLSTHNNSSGVSLFSWRFPVEMRASPTMTYQANGTGSLWYDSGGGYIMTPATWRIGSGGVSIRVTGGNAAAECSGHAFAYIEL